MSKEKEYWGRRKEDYVEVEAGADKTGKQEPTTVTPEMMADGLPKPSGYRILISMPEVERTYAGGIIKSDQAIRNEEVSSVVARVLELGPDAYTDKERYPNGPWCKVGDYVLIRAYSGTRFKVYGKEFRIINEDTVEGVVADPRGYTRI